MVALAVAAIPSSRPVKPRRSLVVALTATREIFTPEQINEFPPFLRASFDIRRLMSTRPTKGFDPQW